MRIYDFLQTVIPLLKNDYGIDVSIFPTSGNIPLSRYITVEVSEGQDGSCNTKGGFSRQLDVTMQLVFSDYQLDVDDVDFYAYYENLRLFASETSDKIGENKLKKRVFIGSNVLPLAMENDKTSMLGTFSLSFYF